MKDAGERVIKNSKLAPAFETVQDNPFGLKHMIPKIDMPMNAGNVVQMKVEAIKPLSNIAPMEKAHAKKSPWKPKGRS